MAEINFVQLTEIENFKDLSPDFYKSDFMAKSLQIRKGNYRRLGQIAYITDGEHGSPSWSQNSGIKYVTAEFIKANYIANGTFKQITVEQDNRNARARLQLNDILIYSVGAYAGLTCLAEPHLFPANIPRSVAIVRLLSLEEFYPEFISVFLNSKYGDFQSLRFRAGNSQPVLALEKIRQFEIPIVDIEFQKEIAVLYQKAYQLRLESQNLYTQATELLEKELGLDKVNFERTNSYVASFSEVAVTRRLDSNHFRPQFKKLVNHLEANFECKKLAYITSLNTRGVQPIYVENGESLVVNSKHLSSTHLKYDNLERTDKSIFDANAKSHIYKGDILIYTTGAYVGLTNVYLGEEKALASNHVNILRINDERIDTTYLALVLNTTIGNLQTQQHIRGSAQAELYPNDIAKFIVPILEEDKMKAIGDLVKQSLVNSQSSKKLLEQAKTRVEELIEEGAKNN